jgi:hypothetical protein
MAHFTLTSYYALFILFLLIVFRRFFMKKLLLLLVVFIIGASGVFAFDILSYPPPVRGGNILVDIGLGFTGTKHGDISIPPLRADVEYALPVGLPISVGGLVAFHQNKYDIYEGEWTYNHFAIGARGNWHWGIDVSWLDLYSGLFLGYVINTVSFDGNSGYPWEDFNKDPSYFALGVQIGAHFYFTEKIGLQVELGYPYWANIGVALKF